MAAEAFQQQLLMRVQDILKPDVNWLKEVLLFLLHSETGQEKPDLDGLTGLPNPHALPYGHRSADNTSNSSDGSKLCLLWIPPVLHCMVKALVARLRPL